jgi:hypothetical protein
MLHESKVNIKNVGLHKKCRLAQRNAGGLAAFLGGPSPIFQRRVKLLRRPLRTLNAGQGNHIRERSKMCGVHSKRPASNLSTRMVEEPALDFENRRYVNITKNESLTAPTLKCCPKMGHTTTLTGTRPGQTAEMAVGPHTRRPVCNDEARYPRLFFSSATQTCCWVATGWVNGGG